MIPVSFSWDTRERRICLKWNGFFSFEKRGERNFIRILRCSIPFTIRMKQVPVPKGWSDVREIFSLLKKWRLKKVEATFSFSDPMVNGVLYGWMSALDQGNPGRRVRVSINFSGENWIRGEAIISIKELFRGLIRWSFSRIRKGR